MGQGLINLPAYLDLQGLDAIANNQTPLYGGVAESANHHILISKPVFFERAAVAGRGTQMPTKGLPAFQSFNGRGNIDVYLARTCKDKRWPIIKARAQLEREIGCLGIPLRSARAPMEGQVETNNFGYSGAGHVTATWGENQGFPNDDVVVSLPWPGQARARDQRGRYDATLEPLSPDFYGDTALYLQKCFIEDRPNLEYYRRDRQGGFNMTPYDDEREALTVYEDGVIAASLNAVAMTARLVLMALKPTLKLDSQGNLSSAGTVTLANEAIRKAVDGFVAPGNNYQDKASATAAQTALNEATAAITRAIAGDVLGVRRNVQTEEQRVARQTLSGSIIHPEAMCNQEVGLKGLKEAPAAAPRLGFLTPDQFHTTCRGRFIPAAPNTELEGILERQKNGTHLVVSSLWQWWQQIRSKRVAKLTTMGDPRKQANMMWTI